MNLGRRNLLFTLVSFAVAAAASVAEGQTTTAVAYAASGSVRHAAVCPGPTAVQTARCHAEVVTDESGQPQTTAVPAGYGPADLRSAYVNAMTSGLGGPQRGQIPMAMPTDRSAVAAALLTCGRADLERARVVRVRSTLDLEHLLVSESLRELVEADDRLSVSGEPVQMAFGDDGRIAGWD